MKRSITHHLLVLLAICLAQTTAMQRTAAQSTSASDKDRAEARNRFDRGLALLDAGDNTGALAEFKRAYELLPHPVVLYNIGMVYAALRRPVEATEALDKLLSAPGSLKQGRVARALRVRKEQAARIAELRFHVARSGAVVEIDNVRVGKTPLSSPVKVGVGSHRVAVVAPGFVPYRTEVTVAGRSSQDVRVDLVPTDHKLARLTVSTQLPGAEVVVDGQVVGTTPLPATIALEPGTRRVEVRRRGYKTARSDITLGEGTTGELTLEPLEDPAEISRIAGLLKLDISETAPVLTVNGKLIPIGSRELRLAPGIHNLRIERAGFLPYEREIDASEGRTERVRIDLIPTADTLASHKSAAWAHRTWGTIAIGAGASMAVAGGIYLAYNARKVSRAEDRNKELETLNTPGSGSECDPTRDQRPGCLPELHQSVEDLREARSETEYGGLALGTGLVVIAGGVILLVTGDDPDRYDRKSGEDLSRQPLTPTFWASGTDTGLGVVGQF